LNVIDLNVLISICEEIQSKRPKSSYDLTLSYEPESDSRERRARLGRFIGKKGQNLKILQEKYNVLIHVNDDNRIGGAFTSEIGREDTNDASKLQMVVRSKHKLIRGAIPIDKIKQEIDEIWEEASETRLIQKQFTFDQNQFQFVSLSFESGLSSEDQSDITGRFIGKKGENLRNLEDEYNIRLHLINHQSSNRKYFQKLIEVQENQPDVFYLFITKKDKSITDEFSIEEIKEKILQKWQEATIEPIDDEIFHILSLSNESEKSLQGDRRKLGCFIGKNGQHLRDLENKYNIKIQIMNSFSTKKIQKRLAKIQDKDTFNKIYLLITHKDKSTKGEILIESIAEELTELWTNEETSNVRHVTHFNLDGEMQQSFFACCNVGKIGPPSLTAPPHFHAHPAYFTHRSNSFPPTSSQFHPPPCFFNQTSAQTPQSCDWCFSDL
jgi:transcription antitermination factor NusA-like protein